MMAPVKRITKGVLLALFYIGVFVFVQNLLMLFAIFISAKAGYNPQDELTNLTGPVNLFSALVSMCVYSAVFYLRGKKMKEQIKRKDLSFSDAMCCIMIALGLRVLTGVYTIWAKTVPVLEKSIENSSLEIDLTTVSDFSSILLVLTICLVAPVFEEILFRGLMQYELTKAGGATFAIILQGVIFGFSHIDAVRVLFTIVIGIVLGLIYHKTKNISMTILIHIVFNISVILKMENEENVMWALLAGVLMTVLPMVFLFIAHRNIKTNDKI